MSGKRRQFVMPYWHGSALSQWRNIHSISAEEMAQRMNISLQSYYRYEGGYPPPVDVATKIVSITNGYIRYRDMWSCFLPQYA